MLNRHKDVLAKKDDVEALKVVKAFAAVLETEPGKVLFAHLFYRAGYNLPDVATNPRDGEISDSASNFNRGRRALYAELRALVPKSHRKTLLEVELLAEEGWGSGLPKPAPTDGAEKPE